MVKRTTFVIFLSAVLSFCISACNVTSKENSNRTASNSASSGKSDSDDVIHSATGVEKEKPEAGKANVQGKVLYDQKPASGIEVKLCEKFSRFLSGCGGQTFTATTDADGEYVIKNVPPGLYEGLTAKVFDTPYYVFATSGIVSSAKYQIEADQTFFAPDTNLFKSDLKLLNPKAAAKVSPDNFELKWEGYQDAAYYKFSLYADTNTGAETNYDYINKRVDGTSYALDKPLSSGSYRILVIAYNSKDVKISQSPDDIKFTVTVH